MNKVRNKMINKEAKSYLAKLLATENLTVEHRKVETAYFDLANRLLVVPIWKEMNNDILDMLLAHEIGHALYTPQDEWTAAVESKVAPHSYLNIVEDARIEKLIKRKYPGLSQSFIKGYRDLIKNDKLFFKDDKFSRTEYEKFLITRGVTAPQFEANIVEQEKRRQFLSSLAGGIVVPETLIEKEFRKENQTKIIQYIDLDKYHSKNQPSPESLKELYQKNKNIFSVGLEYKF